MVRERNLQSLQSQSIHRLFDYRSNHTLGPLVICYAKCPLIILAMYLLQLWSLFLWAVIVNILLSVVRQGKSVVLYVDPN